MTRLWDFGKQLFQRFQNDDVPGLSAQLAYFFLLSLFPFLIFLMTLVAYIPVENLNIIGFLAMYTPDEILRLIEENITQLAHQRNGGLLSIGIIATLWAASNGVNALMRTLNQAYGIEEERSFFVTRGISILLTIAMLFVIIVAFLLPIFGRMIGVALFSWFGLSEGFLNTWNALRWLISTVIFFLVFVMLYRMAPGKTVYFRHVAIGAGVTTIMWQVVSMLFSFYVTELGNFSATYGSLGAVIILMIWFYLSGVILLLGGEINALLESRDNRVNMMSDRR
ncbi:YihY/virulence factor BrkB family protein, partial [Gracilibacillus halophilus]